MAGNGVSPETPCFRLGWQPLAPQLEARGEYLDRFRLFLTFLCRKEAGHGGAALRALTFGHPPAIGRGDDCAFLDRPLCATLDAIALEFHRAPLYRLAQF